MSIQLYGCLFLTLRKRTEKKLGGNYTINLRAEKNPGSNNKTTALRKFTFPLKKKSI